MSREAIFSSIRKAIAAVQHDDRESVGEPARDLASAERRLAQPPRNLLPARATAPGTDLVALFEEQAAGQRAEVIRVENERALPEAIASYLRSHNLPARIRTGNDPLWRRIDLTASSNMEQLTGPAEDGDETGLSHATAAIAETGTVMLTSGPENPVTLNYMPQTHLVVIHASDIVATGEDAFDLVRKRKTDGAQGLPRTINFITGPSRTADIGGRIVIGAHGPRRMAVFVIDDGPGGAKPA